MPYVFFIARSKFFLKDMKTEWGLSGGNNRRRKEGKRGLWGECDRNAYTYV
jgi:hypothetical protein